MRTMKNTGKVLRMLGLGVALGMISCEDNNGGGGGSGLGDIGTNDPNVLICIGDSITQGNNSGHSYPPLLAGMIGKTVVNLAAKNESTASGAAMAGGALAHYKPAAVCVLLGACDIIQMLSQDAALENLRSIVQQAKANKTVPLVATLMPMSEQHAIFAATTREFNKRIRSMVKSEGGRVVDLEKAFGDNASLIGPDGLHPTPAGDQVMAEAFKGKL